jgi:hypothetical protein
MDFKQALEYIGHPARYTGATATRPKPTAPAPVKQGTKADYLYREIVQGGIFNRGNIQQAETMPDYIGTPGAVDCFASLYLHSKDFISYYEKNKKVAGYNGPVWCDTLYFDLDYKDGTMPENIDKAQAETRRLIQVLKSNGISSFKIKFSGSKGFHVSISHPALFLVSGYEKTPLYVERFARKLSTGINCDYSIYGNATRLIRSVNSINSKSGLYAIPLSEGELFTLPVDDVLLLAKQPRPQPKEFKPVRFHSHLLDVDGTIYADRCVFDSGAIFNQQELDLLAKDKNKQNIKAVYLIKKSFGGTVERRNHGKA